MKRTIVLGLDCPIWSALNELFSGKGWMKNIIMLY